MAATPERIDSPGWLRSHGRRIDLASVSSVYRRHPAHFAFPSGMSDSERLLECNPAGQWGWIAEQTGLPIAEAIADELVGARVVQPPRLPLPLASSAVALWFSGKQPPPYCVQALPEGEIHRLIHCAVRSSVPEWPSPPRPGTIRALSPFVGMVLAEQYDDAREQPHGQFLEFRRLWWHRTVEPVHHLLKLFPQEPVSSFPNVTHEGQRSVGKNRDSPCSPPVCLASSVGGTQGRGHSDWAGDGGPSRRGTHQLSGQPGPGAIGKSNGWAEGADSADSGHPGVIALPVQRGGHGAELVCRSRTGAIRRGGNCGCHQAPCLRAAPPGRGA